VIAGPRPPGFVPPEVEAAVTRDLYNLADSTRLCDWMFDQYREFVPGARVAEVGAGIGTFSRRISSGGAKSLLLLEPAPTCAPILEREFDGDPAVRVVRETLPGSPALAEGGFDLVVCQNVLEHIEDDAAAIAAMAMALVPGGRLVLLVPADPRLFGPLDEAYGHYRRYTGDGIRGLLEGAGLEVTVLHPFNTLGIAGWWAKNRRPGAELSRRSLRAYEALVRFWRPIEQRVHPRWGLSVVAHGRRPSEKVPA
jgi:SAM-dependent methyltransferase